MLFSLLIQLTLFIATLGGSITSWDIVTDFTNQGLAKVFQLYFILENGLDSQQYIRFSWPYDLGFTTSFTTAGQWGLVSAKCADPDITQPVEIKRSELAADSGLYIYYARLTNGKTGTFGKLLSGSVYMLKFTAVNTPIITGTVGPIEFYTVSSGGSSTDTDYIILDGNPVFGYLHLTSPPTNTLTVNFSSSASTKNDIAEPNYPITIDISVTKEITGSFRIALETTNTAFEFVPDTCDNLNSTYPSIPYLNVTPTYTYTKNRVYINIKQPLTSTMIMRFQCGIKNPNYVTTGGINVKTMWYSAPHVVEQLTINTGLSTQEWNWGNATIPNKNLKIYLGWGMDFTSTTGLPDCFKIYKSYSATQIVYNHIKFGFAPQHATPTGVEIKLTLQTLNSAAFVIVPSTLTENLPNALNKKVSCTIDSSNTITCTGVGPLSGNIEYFIAFKFYITNAGPANLGTNFGKLTVVDTLSRAIVSTQKADIADNNVYTNKDLFTTNIDVVGNAAFRANQIVHAFKSTLGITAPSNTNYGMNMPSNPSLSVDLIFEHLWRSSEVSGGLSVGDGVEYFTTPALTTLQTTNTPGDCAGEAGVTFAVCEAKTIGSAITSPSRFYTRIRFGPNSNLFNQFPGTSTNRRLRISKMQISKPSSFFLADQGVYDFYARTIAGTMTVGSLSSLDIGFAYTRFFFNGYVVNEGGLSNIHVGLSHFWTGNTANLDGTKFPAYIRIFGYFSSQEMAQMDRLVVFFNGLQVFSESDGTVACGSHVKKLDCYAFTSSVGGFNPTVMNKVIIDNSALIRSGDSNVNRLQIVIPVKTITATSKITLGIATLQYSTFYYTAKNYYDTVFTKMKVQFDYSTIVNSPNNFATLADSSLRITIPPGAEIAQTTSIEITNTIVVDKNEDPDSSSNPKIYAAMSYCAPWGWNTHDQFWISPIPNSVASLYTCINVNYLDSTNTRHYCSYCPIESDLAMTGTPTQKTNNFILPYIEGQDMPGPYLSFSTNNGALYKYGTDTRTSVLNIPTSISNLELVSSPPVLYKGFNNYQISILYTSTRITPKNGKIRVIKSAGPDFGWSYSPITATAYFDGTLCILSTFSSTSFTCTLAATEDFLAGDHNLTIKGVDVLTTGPNSYSFDIEVQIASSKVIETSGVSGSYSIVSSATGYQMEIRDLEFAFGSQGAVSRFSFEFLPGKNVTFSNEQYVFNLGTDFSSAQAGRTILCQVYQGTALTNNIKACSVSDLSQLTLKPSKEYWLDTSINDGYLTVVLQNIQIPASIATQLDGQLRRTATVVQSSTGPQTYPTPATKTDIAGGNLAVSKKFSRDGNIMHLIFSYTPSVDLENNHKIYIYLPHYYSPGIGYQTLYCDIDGDPVYCEIYLPYVIRIQYFTTTYSSGSAHVITIYGIISPKISSVGSIFFALDDDDDLTSFVEQRSIADVNPTQPIFAPLIVYNITTLTTLIRSSTNYTITLEPTAAVPSDRFLVVDFPDSYGSLFSFPVYQPTCTLLKFPDDGTTYASECSFFGARIIVTLSSALSANTQYQLFLDGVRNPDLTLCKQNKLVLSIAGSNQIDIHQRSTPSYVNAEFITYTRDPSLDILSFTTIVGSVTLDEPIIIERGVYSSPICVTPNAEKFKKRFTTSLHNLQTTLFKIHSDPVEITTGHKAVCFRAASYQTTPETVYDIVFNKTETTPAVYTELPRLKVLILDQKVSIGANSTTYDVPLGGISLPILLDLSEKPPASDLTITANLSDATSFMFLENDVLTFDVVNSRGYFILQATAAANVGDTATLTLTLSGTDADSYLLTTPTITLNIVAAPGPFTFEVSFTNNKKSTFQEFSVTVNQPSIVYWGIAMKNTFERTCDYIENGAFTFHKYSNLDYAQEQFGYVILPSSSLTQTFKIENLRSRQDYTVVFCAKSQIREQPTPQIFSFSSVDNNIKIVSSTFNFNGYLTREQEIDFACFLASEFRLYEYNVISTNGVSCADRLPATPLPTVYFPFPQAYLPAPYDTSGLVYTPPSRRRLLGQSRINRTAPIHRNLQNTVPYTFLFYGDFETTEGDNFDLDIEDKMEALNPGPSTTDFTFAIDLNAFISSYTGFPTLASATYNNIIDTVTPNFANYPPISATAGVKWIAIQNLNLDGNGYIYGCVVPSPSSTPNIIQIRFGLNARDSKAAAYRSTSVVQGTSATLNFTGLSNYTLYDIYYYATNEDISRFAITTEIRKITMRTMMAPPEYIASALNLKLGLTIILLILMIFI